MLTKRTLLVVFCSLIFPICPLLYGQATGSFSGTVSDKTGSVISGATVRATSQGTGLAREAEDRRLRTLPYSFAAGCEFRDSSRVARVPAGGTEGCAAADRRTSRSEFHPGARFGRPKR